MDDKKEKFTTRMFHYINGQFQMIEREFDRLEDAIEAGIAAACHSWKVYDQDGQCHHDNHHHHDNGPYC